MAYRLMIVDEQGQAWEVCDGIDEYNLSKPVAQASVIDDIKRTLQMAQQATDSPDYAGDGLKREDKA